MFGMAKQPEHRGSSLEALSGLSDATSRMIDVAVRVVHSKIQNAGGNQSVARPLSQGAETGTARTKREWTIGKITLTDLAGDTVQMIRHMFGSPGHRHSEAQEYMKKFTVGTLWRISNVQKVTRAKSGDEAYSIPWTITYDGSSTVTFKSILQGDKAYSAIPSTMHPGMMIQPLATLDEGRNVSVCALVKGVHDRADTQNGKVANCSLVGADQTMITCAAWRECADVIEANVGNVIYIFHAWALFKDEGDDIGSVFRGLSTTSTTVIVIPQEEQIHEKFQALVSEKKTLMSAKDSEFTMICRSFHKSSRRDYSMEPAVATCVANLKARSKHPQQDAPSQLFLVEAGIGRIILTTALQDLQMADIQTKDGSRVWLDVLLQDLSGGVSCKMGEDVALALIGAFDSDALLQNLKRGKTFLPLRAYKVLVTYSSVEKHVYTNLTIVHADEAPRVPSIVPPEYTNLQGCFPALISQVAKNPFGNMVVGDKKTKTSSEILLVLLEGTKDAVCEQRGSDVYVCNTMVKDLLSPSAAAFPIPVVSAVPLSSVPSMSLHAGRKAIAVITDVIMKSSSEVLEVHVSDMFTASEDDIRCMKMFLDASVDYVNKCSGKRKRQWKDVTSDYVLSLESPHDGA